MLITPNVLITARIFFTFILTPYTIYPKPLCFRIFLHATCETDNPRISTRQQKPRSTINQQRAKQNITKYSAIKYSAVHVVEPYIKVLDLKQK